MIVYSVYIKESIDGRIYELQLEKVKIAAALVKDGSVDKIYQVLELRDVAPPEEENFIDSTTLAAEEEEERTVSPLSDNRRSRKRRKANYFVDDEDDEFAFTDNFVRPQRTQLSFWTDQWYPETQSPPIFQPTNRQIGSLPQLPLKPPSWIANDVTTSESESKSESESEAETHLSETSEVELPDITDWADLADLTDQPQSPVSALQLSLLSESPGSSKNSVFSLPPVSSSASSQPQQSASPEPQQPVFSKPQQPASPKPQQPASAQAQQPAFLDPLTFYKAQLAAQNFKPPSPPRSPPPNCPEWVKKVYSRKPNIKFQDLTNSDSE